MLLWQTKGAPHNCPTKCKILRLVARSSRNQNFRTNRSTTKCQTRRIFFPTCKVRVARFYQNCFSSFSFFSFSSPILFAKCLGNPLCQASRQSSRQASRQSSSPAPDRSVHCWTSSARFRSQHWHCCWTSSARVRAPLDFICQGPSAVCTGGPHSPRPIAVCTAGPQPPKRMPKNIPKSMLEYLPDRNARIHAR